MKVVMHTDDTTQQDFKFGAIEIRTTDPQEAFALGEVMEKAYSNGKRCCCGSWGQGMFIRFPLTERKS